MDVWFVCMRAYKHARIEGSGGMLPQEILEIRSSEIASEAILGQKQSPSSYVYMARGVFHPIFGFPCVHLLSQLTSNFHERRYWVWQNSRWVDITKRKLSSAWTSDLFTHVFTRVLSSQRRKQLTRSFRAGPPWTNSHSCNQTHLDSGDSQKQPD